MPEHSVAAGSSMGALVIVENNSGRAFGADGCSLFQILLSSATIHPESVWPACLQPIAIPAGESSYAVTIEANYPNCVEQVGCPTGQPLPPGTYEATLYEGSINGSPPPPVPVRVTP